MRVVKVGGSLLSGFDLQTHLAQWLLEQPTCPTLVVVGGGELADAVRALDQRYGLSSECAHFQAIRAMQVNSYVLCQLCPSLVWIERVRDWQARRSESRREKASWIRNSSCDTTSRGCRAIDSLAAGTSPVTVSPRGSAVVVEATELVLIKSTLPGPSPPELTFRQAAKTGFVDQHFCVAAHSIERICAVNLRCRGRPELRLVASPG